MIETQENKGIYHLTPQASWGAKSGFVSGLLTLCLAFGKKISEQDFLVGLPIEDSNLSHPMALRALDRIGVEGTFTRKRKITNVTCPCLASMKDGSWLAISRVEKEVVYKLDLQGQEVAIEKADFQKTFDKQVLQAQLKIDDIQTRHVETAAPPHWFWCHFRGQKHIVRDIILCSLIANLLAVAVSLFSLQVYDRVIPNESYATLWVLVMGCAIAILFEAILRVSRAHLLDISGRSIENDVSSKLFEKLQGMKLSERPGTPGTLAYQIREFGSVREFFTAASIGSVADMPFVSVFLVLLYFIAGPVALVVLCGMVLIVVPSLLMRAPLAKLSEEMQGGLSAAGKLTTEVCYNHEAVKTHRAEALMQRKWEEIIQLNSVKTSSQRLLASTLTFWSMAIQQSAHIGSVVVGVYMVFSSQFTVGTIIAVSILSSRTLSPVTQLAGTISRWQQVRTALEGLESIALSKQERDQNRQFVRRQRLDGNLSLKDIQYQYDPELPVSLNVDFLNVSAGETLALLGVNGSGKSTLLRILSGLYEPTGGSLTVDNTDLRHIDPTDLRRNIGYLPQEIKLFTGTLRENILLGDNGVSNAQLEDAIVFAGLTNAIINHPLGLDLPILDGGEGLSVGQKQAVGLARLHIQNPSIVLMDEPTASLDQTAEQQLILKLQVWLQNRTCVLTTHRMPALSLVDNIAVMQNGSVALSGSKNNVLNQLRADTVKEAVNA